MKLTNEQTKEIQGIYLKARNRIISADEAVVSIMKSLSIQFKVSSNYFVGIEVMSEDGAE